MSGIIKGDLLKQMIIFHAISEWSLALRATLLPADKPQNHSNHYCMRTQGIYDQYIDLSSFLTGVSSINMAPGQHIFTTGWEIQTDFVTRLAWYP